MTYTLEVCVDSVASALAAKRGGADRLELCADLIIGGTTPSPALLRQVKAETGLPVRALLRPRFGDFCYDRYELAQMAECAAELVAAGADGIVTGVLTPAGALDTDALRPIYAAARQAAEKAHRTVDCTLHRAFDVCCDPFAALEAAKQLGLATILTSGQAASAPQGAALLQQLVEAAALAESWSKHPISLSIKAAYGKEIDTSRVTDVEELGGHGVTAKVDGRTVAAGNARLMAKLGLTVPEITEPGTIVHVAMEGRYAGYLLIADVVKPHSAAAIKGLKQAGVRKTVMLTGDAQPVAQAVAQQLGLDEYHAGLLPGDKVDQIETLLAAKQPKENLAFVGDGINDAPVLSRADVGIAMGALGSDAAIEAADVVLMDDDPAKIALAMRIARRTLRIVYQNIVFALAIKFACLVLGALGLASMWTAIFADVGVMVLAVLNATRALYTKDLAKKNAQ